MMHKKIGIWGFGTVGKSALTYLAQEGNRCTVLDKRNLSQDEKILLTKHNAAYLPEEQLDYFFLHNDYIFASPGIDINPYTTRTSFLCELDLFASAWHKPIIAVTGTVGKTSTTTLLGNLLAQTMHVAVGGNIGTAMLSFVPEQQQYDCAILELSSWQLEHAKPWAPDIAIWTNFSANHLDRHHTMHAYFNAKLQIMLHQTEQQTAVLPLSLREHIAPLNIASKKIWITDIQQDCILHENEYLLYCTDEDIVLQSHEKLLRLGPTSLLPHDTFIQNALCAVAVLHTLALPIDLLSTTSVSIEHRLELVGKKNSILFYNDSKSTVPESTLAAVRQCAKKNIVLIVGGLSKGVDRSQLIQSLPPIKKVICFGKEAQMLHEMCTMHGVQACATPTLDQAFVCAVETAADDDIVLLSPAGSSFDLYTDYAQRGKHFKQLVYDLINN